ncbi:MAG TPA: hypothetical protein PK007_00775, partial [Candidatus Kapabacteria bacterium]|nr:hypothetical protein [Candidatus Kapabacteria bacterium]
VLADNYDELFSNADATEVNLFELGELNKKLEEDLGYFSMHELKIKANELLADGDNLKALYFVLQASNLTSAIFVRLHAGGENLFVGKVSNKLSSADECWVGQVKYRVYSFTAYSFDFSILKEVKLTKKMQGLNGNTVSSIYNRLRENNWALLNSITMELPGYAFDDGTIAKIKLVNLYKFLATVLKLSGEIIAELNASTVNFVLGWSDVGISTQAVNVNAIRAGREYFADFYVSSKKINLQLIDMIAATSDNFSPIFISAKLIKYDLEMGLEEAENNAALKALDFTRYDNVAELLADIARALNCYLVTTINNNEVLIEFVGRGNLLKSTVYLHGASAGDLTTAAVFGEEANIFGTVNGYARERWDIISYTKNDGFGQVPKLNGKYLPLSIGTARANYAKSTLKKTYSGLLGYYSDKFPAPFNDFDSSPLTNNIYIRKFTDDEPEQYERGLERVYRPAFNVLVKIDGNDHVFDTLSEYINYVQRRDKEYYFTEYSLTLPFVDLVADSENEPGSITAIDLNKQMVLSERVFINGEETFVKRTYSINEFSIDIANGSVKLGLINASRYAFSQGQIAGASGLLSTTDEDDEEEKTIVWYPVEPNNPIAAGDAVMWDDDFVHVIKCLPNKYYKGRFVGIALHGIDDEGGMIDVQTSGIVESTVYNFQVGKQINVRVVSPEECNLKQDLLHKKNVYEDMVILVGIANSSNSFKLDVRELVL